MNGGSSTSRAAPRAQDARGAPDAPGAQDAPRAEGQAQINERLWAQRDLVREYAGRTLRPVEVMLLVRYREALGGRVLELGSGGGRLSGYLLELAREFEGIDISPRMVEHCTRVYPGGRFAVGDLRELGRLRGAAFDVVVAPFNVLDVLDDDERRRVLGDIRRLLGERGLLIFSSHNLAHAPFIPAPTSVRARNPVRALRELARVPRRARNRRRLLAHQRSGPDHAIITDEAHDYSVLHYYIERDHQQRQLASAGFDLLECLDLDGRPVAQGERAEHHPELHYVARRAGEPRADG